MMHRGWPCISLQWWLLGLKGQWMKHNAISPSCCWAFLSAASQRKEKKQTERMRGLFRPPAWRRMSEHWFESSRQHPTCIHSRFVTMNTVASTVHGWSNSSTDSTSRKEREARRGQPWRLRVGNISLSLRYTSFLFHSRKGTGRQLCEKETTTGMG